MELTKKELEILLILLLGSKDAPIPSLEHAKAGIFVLLKVNPEGIKDILNDLSPKPLSNSKSQKSYAHKNPCVRTEE